MDFLLQLVIFMLKSLLVSLSNPKAPKSRPTASFYLKHSPALLTHLDLFPP